MTIVWSERFREMPTTMLKHGIDTFFYHMKPLYEACNENWKRILPLVYEFAEREKKKIKIPKPWGEWDVYKAARFLFKRSWRIIHERPVSKRELSFINKVERIARKLPFQASPLFLIKALSEV